MLASRLLSILILLQTRGRMSARELAAEFEVAVRTIHRDIDQLSAAGIPVYADRGRTGGFRLQDGYRTRLTGLTQSEAETLFLAGLPGPAEQLGLADVLSSARLKLLAALPATVQPRAQRIAARFHLDAVAWFHGADRLPSLPAIAGAAWSDHMLELRYRRSGDTEARPRVVAPLGLVLKAGVWYLVAAVPDDDRGPRTYRLSRIEAATALDESFERPAGFHLQDHWRDYQRDYERRLFKSSATIRLSEGGRQLLFRIGSIAARAGHAAMGPTDSDGWATTTVPIESVRHATHSLMQLGAEVEVLEPRELRDAISRAARAMTERYADESGGTSARGGLSRAGGDVVSDESGSADDAAAGVPGGSGLPPERGSSL